jgi:hypothetical protein
VIGTDGDALPGILLDFQGRIPHDGVNGDGFITCVSARFSGT